MDHENKNIPVNDETMEQVAGGAYGIGAYRTCPCCKANRPFGEFLNYQGRLICVTCLKKLGVNKQTLTAEEQSG